MSAAPEGEHVLVYLNGPGRIDGTTYSPLPGLPAAISSTGKLYPNAWRGTGAAAW